MKANTKTPIPMSEDAVLNNTIKWFIERGWEIVYQTRSLKDGAIGGVDAILYSDEFERFVFIDAKGTAATKEKKSVSFTNALGALIKRVRFSGGYSGVEDAKRFTDSKWRKRVSDEASHRRSNYVLALTSDYEQTVRSALDPTLAELLNIHAFIVTPEGVTELKW
jgi:hypothetical protein